MDYDFFGERKSLIKMEPFYQGCTSFFTDGISTGYPEKVPQSHLDCEEGHVWYFPHHEAYRPWKNTARVVFDWSSI